MYFNIPAIGAMFAIQEPLKLVNIEKYGLQCLAAFKDCKKTVVTKKYSWSEETYDVTTVEGEFTFPKGTIFKVEAINIFTPRDKERNKRQDCISISVVDTSLAYCVDDEFIKTPTGRISKRKKDRPKVTFIVTLDMFQNISCEITV